MRRFPSKIILFGEYSVLIGSDALAIPFPGFAGEWSYEKENDTLANSSRKSLTGLSSWLHDKENKALTRELYDLDAFDKALEAGLYFNSDIPLGSGLGSSGALVAAFFYQFTRAGVSSTDLLLLQKRLAALESYFHTRSSGIDPLVSYCNKPLIFSAAEHPKTIESINEQQMKRCGLFLVRSKQERDTASLVKGFRERYKRVDAFRKAINTIYTPLNNLCIKTISEHQTGELFHETVRQLSLVQSELFQDLFPAEIAEAALYGNQNKLFSLKLCGSGGGGYFMGFTNEQRSTMEYFERLELDIVFY